MFVRSSHTKNIYIYSRICCVCHSVLMLCVYMPPSIDCASLPNAMESIVDDALDIIVKFVVFFALFNSLWCVLPFLSLCHFDSHIIFCSLFVYFCQTKNANNLQSLQLTKAIRFQSVPIGEREREREGEWVHFEGVLWWMCLYGADILSSSLVLSFAMALAFGMVMLVVVVHWKQSKRRSYQTKKRKVEKNRSRDTYLVVFRMPEYSIMWLECLSAHTQKHYPKRL